MPFYRLVLISLCTSLAVSGVRGTFIERSRIFVSGLTSALWDPSEPIDQAIASLEATCASVIHRIHSRLSEGKKDAFQFVDFSSKGLVGALQGELIALGEYDPCLKRGHQYCSVSVLAHKKAQETRATEDDTIHLEFHLCLPLSCSPQDLVNLIKNRVLQYPITIAPPRGRNNETAITCDSLQSNSLYSRVTRLSYHQIISIAFICILIIVLVTSYLSDLINMDSCFTFFSLRRSINTLLSPDHQSIDLTSLPLDTVKVTLLSAPLLSPDCSCLMPRQLLVSCFSLSIE